jgi:putative ABC transport system permease protein
MWRRYLRFWGPHAEADVDDELQFHVEMRVAEYMKSGMDETHARAAVARRLGDLPAARAECVAIDTRREHRMSRTQWFDAFVQDLRFGARMLLRQKAWTAVGILTLALGIGANTAVFSVVNQLLLHPLPYPGADRMALVYEQPQNGGASGVSVYLLANAPTFRRWRADAHSFDDLEGWTSTDVVFRQDGGKAAVLHSAAVLPSFAEFAGVRPILGRNFDSTDVAARAHVVLLSEALWRGRFGSDPHVVGRTLDLNGNPYTVVGVMPRQFRLPALLQTNTDVFTPLDLTDTQIGLSIVGRLRPGVTIGAAQRELDSILVRSRVMTGFRVQVVPPDRIVHFRDSLMLLAAAVALVLIIACVNVAHLLLARGATRRREMAVRAALGAGGGRLTRQLLTESLLLALAGCAAGILVGWGGLRALVALRPESLSQLSLARLDGTTLLVAAGLSLATGIAFGLVGAVQSTGLHGYDVLKAGGRSLSAGRSHDRVRSALVVTEMALCTALLVGATLLVRSVAHLASSDPGFDVAGLYSFNLNFSATSDTSGDDRWRFADQVVQRARHLPGVQAMTVDGVAPPGQAFTVGALAIEGRSLPKPGGMSFISVNPVRPDFFRLMGMHFVQGATFTDTTAAAAQVIVNQGMARRYWPNGSAIGQHVRVGFENNGPWLTIVGVVNDASTGGLGMQAGEPMFYFPRMTDISPAILARLTNPEVAIPAMRSLVASMNPAIPPLDATDVANAMAATIGGQRFTMLLLAVFTGLALVLAAVGLYGVMAYAVAQRTREIGIRVALGATRTRIARRVLTRGLTLGAIGMAVGLVGAHWGTRLLSSMLSGVSANDPASFTAAGAVLLATVALACVVPMRRAMRVDPVVAMREE